MLSVAGRVRQRLDSPYRSSLRRGARTRHPQPRSLDEEPWYPLTVREFEVARLIAAGLTNAEIAAELSISPKTVSTHVEHILAKLAVARRAEIAAWVTTVSRTTNLARHPGGGRLTTPCLPGRSAYTVRAGVCIKGRFRPWGTTVRQSRAIARPSSPVIWPAGRAPDELATDDFVQEWPQSGERIRKEGSRKINEMYADKTGNNPKMDIRGIRESGDLVVIEGTIDYGNGVPVSYVGIAEFEGGKVHRITEYFADPFEPPAWRAPFVEQMAAAGDVT